MKTPSKIQLKAEIERLKSDIYTLVKHPNSLSALEVIHKWNTYYETIDLIDKTSYFDRTVPSDGIFGHLRMLDHPAINDETATKKIQEFTDAVPKSKNDE